MKYVIVLRATYPDRVRQGVVTPEGREYANEELAQQDAAALAFAKNLAHEFFPETSPSVRTWVKAASR